MLLNGVIPLSFSTLSQAPELPKICTILKWLFLHAKRIADSCFFVTALRLQFEFIKILTASMFPFWAAICRGASPISVDNSKSTKLFETKNSMISEWLCRQATQSALTPCGSVWLMLTQRN